MRKYPLKEIPSLIYLRMKVAGQMKNKMHIRIMKIARIIRSPDDFGKFKAGEILVAPTTDPMWTNLFPIAKAVVTEMGGVLSHASIVAREYGTPCVVNIQGIIAALEDGDLIEVDGTSGVVKIISTKPV